LTGTKISILPKPWRKTMLPSKRREEISVHLKDWWEKDLLAAPPAVWDSEFEEARRRALAAGITSEEVDQWCKEMCEDQV